MNIKKSLLCLAAATMFAAPAFAIDFSCEPEDNDAFSYGVLTNADDYLETTFVKYTPHNGQDQYWLRASGTKGAKLLQTIVLDIDGVKYTINSSDPTSIQANASITKLRSFIGSFIDGGPVDRTTRYFNITPEIANALRHAKTVRITFSTHKILNDSTQFSDKYLSLVQQAYSLEYKDYPEYWKPIDKSKSKE